MNEQQKAIDLLASIQRDAEKHANAYTQISTLMDLSIAFVEQGTLSPEDAMAVARFTMCLMSDLKSGNETPADVAHMAEKASQEN